jgi:hypothetical protein
MRYETVSHYQEQRQIEKYYRFLFDQNVDVYQKLLAIDYLSYFAHLPEHRAKLEYLEKKEMLSSVAQKIKEVLDGNYKPLVDTDPFFDDEIIELEAEVRREKLLKKEQVRQELSSTVFFRKMRKF